jgi:hypothetical protein
MPQLTPSTWIMLARAIGKLGGIIMKRFALALVASGALSFGLAQTASAADLPVKARAPYVPPFSWTGFYIGGNLGAGAARFTALDFDGIFDFGDFTTNHIGWTAGVQAGYNYQTGGLAWKPTSTGPRSTRSAP